MNTFQFLRKYDHFQLLPAHNGTNNTIQIGQHRLLSQQIEKPQQLDLLCSQLLQFSTHFSSERATTGFNIRTDIIKSAPSTNLNLFAKKEFKYKKCDGLVSQIGCWNLTWYPFSTKVSVEFKSRTSIEQTEQTVDNRKYLYVA